MGELMYGRVDVYGWLDGWMSRWMAEGMKERVYG
jgi:hypothetical protein